MKTKHVGQKVDRGSSFWAEWNGIMRGCRGQVTNSVSWNGRSRQSGWVCEAQKGRDLILHRLDLESFPFADRRRYPGMWVANLLCKRARLQPLASLWPWSYDLDWEGEATGSRLWTDSGIRPLGGQGQSGNQFRQSPTLGNLPHSCHELPGIYARLKTAGQHCLPLPTLPWKRLPRQSVSSDTLRVLWTMHCC